MSQVGQGHYYVDSGGRVFKVAAEQLRPVSEREHLALQAAREGDGAGWNLQPPPPDGRPMDVDAEPPETPAAPETAEPAPQPQAPQPQAPPPQAPPPEAPVPPDPPQQDEPDDFTDSPGRPDGPTEEELFGPDEEDGTQEEAPGPADVPVPEEDDAEMHEEPSGAEGEGPQQEPRGVRFAPGVHDRPSALRQKRPKADGDGDQPVPRAPRARRLYGNPRRPADVPVPEDDSWQQNSVVEVLLNFEAFPGMGTAAVAEALATTASS